MVAAGRGNMPGQFVLNGFIALRPDAEIAKHVDLLRHLDDPAAVARYQVFEDWFKHTQDVPGTFYLWLVEHLFAGNELITGDLVVGGERVDLGALSCPLFLLGGATDHITPPVQVFRGRGRGLDPRGPGLDTHRPGRPPGPVHGQPGAARGVAAAHDRGGPLLRRRRREAPPESGILNRSP